MKRLIVLTATIISLATLAAPHRADAGTDPFIGEISMFAGTFPPRGWAFCEGQTLKIAENTALYSLLGTTYGGDGKTTFKLPDFRESEKKLRKDAGIKEDAGGPRYIIAIHGIYPSRN